MTGSRRTDIGWSPGSCAGGTPAVGVWSAIERSRRGDVCRYRCLHGGRAIITPRFNDLRYLEKPPLLYWLIASAYRLAGPSEWGAHLWPALAEWLGSR